MYHVVNLSAHECDIMIMLAAGTTDGVLRPCIKSIAYTYRLCE